jgi:hypothetical protein
MAGSIARTIFLGTTWLFVACSVLQVFLAGLGVFGDPAAFITHRDFGYLFGWLIIVLIVAAIVGRMGRMYIGGSVLLMVLFTLQSVFVAVRADMPGVAALHPLNGFVIVLVGLLLGWRAWSKRRAIARSL